MPGSSYLRSDARHKYCWLLNVALPVVLSIAMLASGTTAQEQPPAANAARNSTPVKSLAKIRVPAEFERQRGIILSVSDWMPHHFQILVDICESTRNHVNVLILYNDKEQLRQAATMLVKSGSYSHVYFCPLELDTVWLRDFGPRIAEVDGGAISVDFFYEGSRPRDDSFPRRWAAMTGTRLRTVRWTAQGGNLITNGSGLGVTSNRIFQDNYIQFPNARPGLNVEVERRQMVTKDFKRSFNLSELVVLEPLQQEATKHVDMFMNFIGPQDVLVAQVDQFRDPVNAGILNRNAQRLSTVQVNGRRLNVHRIALPPREGTYWSPYTNIIMANGLILMPTFDSDAPQFVSGAISTYRRLLPNYEVKTINMTSMKALQGSLHCLSLNLPKFAPWPPRYYTYEQIEKALK